MQLAWLEAAAEENCSSTESTAAALPAALLAAAQAEQPATWKRASEAEPEEGKKAHRGAAEALKARRPEGGWGGRAKGWGAVVAAGHGREVGLGSRDKDEQGRPF